MTRQEVPAKGKLREYSRITNGNFNCCILHLKKRKRWELFNGINKLFFFWLYKTSPFDQKINM